MKHQQQRTGRTGRTGFAAPLALALLTLCGATSQAAQVDVRLTGTVVSGGTFGVSFAGQSIVVGFSYDSATAGVAGVFSGGVNFLNPFIDLAGVRYVNFSDHLAPVHPTTLTLVEGSPDRLALDLDISRYEGITDKTESLDLSFQGASSFLDGNQALPTLASALGSGTGSFSVIHADDCQNYACGPQLPFFANATFTLNRIEITPAPVPEPASQALYLLGLLGMGAWSRRRNAAAG